MDLLIVGHHAAVASYFFLGDLVKAREHADQVLALYSEERHGHLVNILGNDPKTFSLIWKGMVTWMLGYPGQAMEIRDATEAHARQRGHPFDLCYALTAGGRVLICLAEADEQLRRVAEAKQLGIENNLPFILWACVPNYSGQSLIQKSQFVEGVAALKSGLAVWEGGGGRLDSPYLKSAMAEGMVQLGDLDGALNLIDEILAQIERPGWEERYQYAEVLRIKGELFSLKGDLQGSERNYLASLDWARQQQAKSWELRTATSYARLMQGQGRVREACELLAPIFNWFTEGFGTKDLREAKALLDELRERTHREPAEGIIAAKLSHS
jgi:hypothetical protein